MTPKLFFTLDRSAEHELADRAKRLSPDREPPQLEPKDRALLFLRGVYSRVTLALPAFYLSLSTRTPSDQACSIEGYPGVVLRYSLESSSVNTLSLACRKAFDHAAQGLTGAVFFKISESDLEYMAEKWAKTSGRSTEDAFKALLFLKAVFCDCSRTTRDLLKASTLLAHRIGLLKQHADRSAAHLSLQNYEFSILDCSHVVAALVLIAEIVRSFDEPQTLPTYFDTLDEASLSAARKLFPSTPDMRLFEDIKIETQARLCWQSGTDHGRHMLLEQLPYALGWY